MKLEAETSYMVESTTKALRDTTVGISGDKGARLLPVASHPEDRRKGNIKKY